MAGGLTNKLARVRVVKTVAGRYSFHWQAELVASGESFRRVRAIFAVPARQVGRVIFTPGDVMIETYYNHCWYNNFTVFNGGSPDVKCVYLNLSRPAVFSAEVVTWDDLALDLVVYPDGSRDLLDQDEFASLNLDFPTRKRCWSTVDMLLDLPFTELLPG